MPQFHKIAKIAQITERSPLCIEVEGRRIALFNLGGRIYAIDDLCTHEGGPLSEGAVEDEEVACPWHGARFNIRTGAACCLPAYEDVPAYPVRVVGEDVEVEV